MWEIFLSVDSHDSADSADRLTVGILHLFHQNVSHFFTHLPFLPLTTLLMSPFCFCLLLGFCHKWNEGRVASLVKSLARSYNVHSSCIQEKWEWKHVLNQAEAGCFICNNSFYVCFKQWTRNVLSNCFQFVSLNSCQKCSSSFEWSNHI